MNRVPIQQMDGMSSRAQFYRDIVNTADMELRQRFQARTLRFGVGWGFTVTDGTTGSVTGVNVTSGVAWNNIERRTFLGGDTFYALTAAKNGKYLIVRPTYVSGSSEKHPITGASSPTKITDSCVLSAVVTPNSSLGHIRLGKIERVRKFGSGGVDFRTAPLIDRDNLLVGTPFPTMVIGPSGDPDCDFAGSDETPFIQALDALTATSGGIIYIKKGSYAINRANGVPVSGFQSIQFCGQGKATRLRFPGAGPSDYGFRVFDNSEFIFEKAAIVLDGDQTPAFHIKDTGFVKIRRNYCSGVDLSWVATVVSGINYVWFSRNLMRNSHTPGEMIIPFKHSVYAADDAVGLILVDGNYCSGVDFRGGRQIETVVVVDNILEFVEMNSMTSGWGSGTYFSWPRRFLTANNVWNQVTGANTYQTSASGQVFFGNVLDKRAATIGLKLLDDTADSGRKAFWSSIAGNLFIERKAGSVTTVDAETTLSGVSVAGNLFYADGASASQKPLALPKRSIGDGNIFVNYGTPATAGAGSWIGTTNKTSNRNVTG
jgi:hypothetical protein